MWKTKKNKHIYIHRPKNKGKEAKRCIDTEKDKNKHRIEADNERVKASAKGVAVGGSGSSPMSRQQTADALAPHRQPLLLPTADLSLRTVVKANGECRQD